MAAKKWSAIWRPGREPAPGADPGGSPGAGRDEGAGPGATRDGGAGVARNEDAGVDPDGAVTPALPLLAVRDPRIPAELLALRSRVAGIDAVLVASADGVVLAHDPAGGDVGSASRVASGMLAQGRHAAIALGRGRFRNSVIWASDGYLAVYPAGPEALLLVLAGADTNVGSLHVEARASSSAIAGLLTGGG